MIDACKQYITNRGKDTIWSQDRTEVRNKLNSCIRLNQVYRTTYAAIKRKPLLPQQPPLQFSENYVFGKFDTFCNRLKRILSIFDSLDDFKVLFDRKMEGL